MSHFSYLIAALLITLQGTGQLLANSSDTLSAQESREPIVMRFGGDCLLTDHYEEAVGDSVEYAFKNFDLFKTADVSMVNLESPVTTRGVKVAKPFNFRMNPHYLDALGAAGIRIVNIANNHIFDYGDEGLFDTISYLDSAGIRHVGAGRTRVEARRPVVVDVMGRKVGILGYYGGGEAPTATADSPGVARRAFDLIAKDVSSLKQRDSVQFVIVSLHWGTEKAEEPDRSQVELAHMIIDAGADAVIGHHPHVLQGIECYKSGVIAYSLGNLIFGGNSRDSYDTGLLQIKLGSDSAEYSFIPVRVNHWKATAAAGVEAERILEHIQQLSSKFPVSIFNKKERR